MNWTKLLYVLIIVLLYIPMTFLGANVFFPKYTGQDSYYRGPMDDCYIKYPYPDMMTKNLTDSERQTLTENQRLCQEANMEKERLWQQEKNAYEGNKYVVVTIFNLLVLLFALLVPVLLDSVVMGLFLGSIAATFGATIRYFDTHSRIGFIVMVVTFFTMIYFINKKKDTFMDWKTKDDKKEERKRK
jgi:hypothetical protein